MHINPQDSSADAGDDRRENSAPAHSAPAQSSITRRVAMLRSVSALALTTAPTFVSSAHAEQHADAELLALAGEWRAAVVAADLAEQKADMARREDCEAREAEMSAAIDRVNDLSDAIFQARANTLAGLAVKAQVVRREMVAYGGVDSDEHACACALELVDAILSMGETPIAPDASLAAAA
jgi:hypothetical protein